MILEKICINLKNRLTGWDSIVKDSQQTGKPL